MKTIRKITHPDFSGWILTGIFLVIVFSACNTRIEGCLDVNAENFDLNGERACDDCCTYPSMQLSLTQKWNDENFSNEDTLFDNQSQSYRITDLKYFMTTWSWRDAEGTLFTVDTIEEDCNGAPFRFTPDILVIDTRQFLYTLGTIRVAPHIASINATLGLTEDYSCLDEEDVNTPASVTDQSPLWNSQSGKLETIRLILQKDIAIEVYDTLYVDYTLGNSLAYDFEMEKGIDTPLELSVNYALWFQDVNVNDLSSFETSLRNNIPGSIIRTP